MRCGSPARSSSASSGDSCAAGCQRTVAPSAIDAIRAEASAIAATGSAGSGSPWTLSRRARRSSRPASTFFSSRGYIARPIAATPSGTNVAPTSSACWRLPGTVHVSVARIAAPPASATTNAIVATVITSAAAERIENSSLRSIAVPITTKLIKVAIVVSAHTACSKIPSSGPKKYAEKPKHQRNHSAAITVRAPRSVVCRHARMPSAIVSSVAGRKNTYSEIDSGPWGSTKITIAAVIAAHASSAARHRHAIAGRRGKLAMKSIEITAITSVPSAQGRVTAELTIESPASTLKPRHAVIAASVSASAPNIR